MSNLVRVAALGLIIGVPLIAQDSPPTASTEATSKVGIGVSVSPTAIFIDDFGFLPFGLANILIPIRIAPNTMLEPEVGLLRSSVDDIGGSASFTNARIGVGLLMGLRERSALKPYIGPRVVYSRFSTKSDSPGGSIDSKQTTWMLSGVLGAQHFFSPHFSLGAEAQLSRASVGEEQGTGGTGNPAQTIITTNGLVTLRWFF